MKNLVLIMGIFAIALSLCILSCGGEDLEKENWCEACCNNVRSVATDQDLCNFQGDGYPCDLSDWKQGCIDFCEGEYVDSEGNTYTSGPWSDDAKDCVYSVNSFNELQTCIQEYPEIMPPQ